MTNPDLAVANQMQVVAGLKNCAGRSARPRRRSSISTGRWTVWSGW